MSTTVGSNILTATSAFMLTLTTADDVGGAPTTYSKAEVLRVEDGAVDRSFSVIPVAGRDTDVISPGGMAHRTLSFVVRVLLFNEGRSETDFGIIVVQDAERIQDAVPYRVRTTVAGCMECVSAGEWVLSPIGDGPGAYVLELPFRAVYVDAHRTT